MLVTFLIERLFFLFFSLSRFMVVLLDHLQMTMALSVFYRFVSLFAQLNVVYMEFAVNNT